MKIGKDKDSLDLDILQIKPVGASLAEITFGDTDDELKKFKSAFLLFCQGNTVSIIPMILMHNKWLLFFQEEKGYSQQKQNI